MAKTRRPLVLDDLDVGDRIRLIDRRDGRTYAGRYEGLTVNGAEWYVVLHTDTGWVTIRTTAISKLRIEQKVTR